ncbi:ATP-binding protein [Streptomyces sp. NPDC093221]|uniref:ATP-binding protein n=1 Tax=Streptomyces sp. NPDC093221 TaxID=3366032 RepID=UPI00380AF1E7
MVEPGSDAAERATATPHTRPPREVTAMAALTGLRTPPITSSRPSGDVYAVFRLAARRTSVSAARHEARAELDRWGLPEGVRDDIVLVVSELVTNAIVHSLSDSVTCHLRGGGPEVYVEVGSEGRSASRHDARPPDEGGRGLVVVEALSTTWGINVPSPGAGWTAWATFTVRAAPADDASATYSEDPR